MLVCAQFLTFVSMKIKWILLFATIAIIVCGYSDYKDVNNADSAGNILGNNALITGYPSTPTGQLNYLTNLTRLTIEGNGEGVIYWDPAFQFFTSATYKQ